MASSSNTIIRPDSDDDDDDKLRARIVALFEALYCRGREEASEDDYDDHSDDGDDDLHQRRQHQRSRITQRILAYRSRHRVESRALPVVLAVSGDMATVRARCYTESLFEDHDEDQKRLLSLVENGRHAKMKALLERKPNLIRAKYLSGETVLHLAAIKGHVDTVKQLVEIIFKKKEIKAAGENIYKETDHRDMLRAKTLFGETVLHAVARSGHMDMVKHLVGVISKNEEGSGARARAPLLLEANRDGDTAVHVAFRMRNTAVATYLIRKQPYLAYKVNNVGVSPLFYAIQGKHEYLVETLFKVLPGKDVAESIKQKLVRPEAPLAHEALKAGNIAMLGVLLDNIPCLINSKDKRGLTSLSYAACKGYYEEVAYFLEVFPKCEEEPNDDGSFPIHKAARAGRVSVLKEFLSRRPDTIYQITKDRHTILHIALRHGKNKVLIYLKNEHAQGLMKIIGNKNVEEVLQEVRANND